MLGGHVRENGMCVCVCVCVCGGVGNDQTASGPVYNGPAALADILDNPLVVNAETIFPSTDTFCKIFCQDTHPHLVR